MDSSALRAATPCCAFNPKQAARADMHCVFFFGGGGEDTVDGPPASLRAPSPPPPDENLGATYGDRLVRAKSCLRPQRTPATPQLARIRERCWCRFTVTSQLTRPPTPDDPNDDECCQCGKTGVPPNAPLVCCDTCSAAWHMHCKPQIYEGISASQLPRQLPVPVLRRPRCLSCNFTGDRQPNHMA